jgi:hypothetical protein
MIEIVMSALSISPALADNTLGADIFPTLILRLVIEANLLKTPTAKLSIPFKFPWLSSIGTIITKRKFTLGATLE